VLPREDMTAFLMRPRCHSATFAKPQRSSPDAPRELPTSEVLSSHFRESCVRGHIAQRPGRIVTLPDLEVAMNTRTFPTSFGEALRQVFAGGYRVASPDLQNLSDRGLTDISLIRGRTDFKASKPSWLA
jgi:hypothetical protein